jgi:hypothetical protein
MVTKSAHSITNNKLKNEQLEAQFPLFKELSQWLGHDMNNNDEFTKCAEGLIRMVDDENISYQEKFGN